MSVRFFMLQAHYRSILDFSDDAILAAEKGHDRLMQAMEILKEIQPGTTSSFDIKEWRDAAYEAMNDDFNTPILIAQLFEGVKFINLMNDGSANLTAQDLELFGKTMSDFIYDVLAFGNVKADSNNDKLEGLVNLLIGMRNNARANKDFALSDQIRDQLTALGIQLKDGKDGTTFSL